MNRKHIALEFVEKYGDKLTTTQKIALTKLGKGIINEDLDRNQIIKHKKKMQSLMQLFKQK
jgi:hypothetical protein